jgi:hypothetical protein
MHAPVTSAVLAFHPLAKNFPLMNGSEFNELVQLRRDVRDRLRGRSS